jgi:hypothetical protein
MSITSASPIAASVLAPSGTGAESRVQGASGPAALRGKDFSSILEQARGATPEVRHDHTVKPPFDIKAAEQMLGVQLHRDVVVNRAQVLGGTSFSARELLAYQIKAGELSLRVEMLSKLADSFVGTVRKLQSQP